jgi:hypothetical protein
MIVWAFLGILFLVPETIIEFIEHRFGEFMLSMKTTYHAAPRHQIKFLAGIINTAALANGKDIATCSRPAAGANGGEPLTTNRRESSIMAVSRFKHPMNAVKALAAAAALTAMLCGTASAADAPLTPTREYRIWSAEQMIKRLTPMFAKSRGMCQEDADWHPRLSDSCTAAVIAAYPILTTIREIARGGDEVQWVAIVYAAHTLEDKIHAIEWLAAWGGR